jgi:hypothetical protein
MHRSRRVMLCLVLSAVCLAPTGCSLEKTGGNSGEPDAFRLPALRVGDRLFSSSDLESFFVSRMNEFPAPGDLDDVKSALLETFIEHKLLLSEAGQRGIAVNAVAVKALLAEPGDGRGEKPPAGGDDARRGRIEESLRVQQYVNQFVLKELRVSEEECRNYYQEHLAEFIRNDVVHIREILVEDARKAERLQSELKAHRNRNFAELARLHSKAPTANQGGDLGRFQRGELPEKIEKAVFRLAPGTVSKTIATEFGYHIFMVEEKVLAHQQKYYEAKKEIETKLMLEYQRNAIEREIASLSQRVPVEIYRERLGFQYTGTRYSSLREGNP